MLYDEETEKILLVCNELDFFGELALVLNQERAASVRAARSKGDSTMVLWKLDQKDFLDALQDAPMAEVARDYFGKNYESARE